MTIKQGIIRTTQIVCSKWGWVVLFPDRVIIYLFIIIANAKSLDHCAYWSRGVAYLCWCPPKNVLSKSNQPTSSYIQVTSPDLLDAKWIVHCRRRHGGCRGGTRIDSHTLASIPKDDTPKLPPSILLKFKFRTLVTPIIAQGRSRFGVFLQGGLHHCMGNFSFHGFFSNLPRTACRLLWYNTSSRLITLCPGLPIVSFFRDSLPSKGWTSTDQFY